MNVIIPLGGIGQRFAEHGYTDAKPLVKVFGKPILFWLIDSLRFEDDDQLYIIAQQDLKKFYLEEQLLHRYAKARLHYLPFATRGAAETLLEGCKCIESDRKSLPTICVDGDSFFSVDILKIYRSSEDKIGIFYFKDFQETPLFSYITCDDSGMLSQIKEKEKISDNACCGAYCFESVELLAKYAAQVVLCNQTVLGEFYTSTIFQLLISAQCRVRGFEIPHDNFHCLGTPFQMIVFYNNVPRQFAVEGALPINIEPRRFCFDLDNTLVGPPTTAGDYSTVTPMDQNIHFLRYLKGMGHYVIIHTARRMRTHNGNVGKVTADIGEVTIATLKEFNIPYDELHFGKPYADFYIDDKAITAYGSLEKSLGYYYTKVEERDFNSIASSCIQTVVKRSMDHKLLGEIYWYKSMPNEIKDLFPIFLRSGSESSMPYWYEVEKVSGVSVSQLWTSGIMKPDLIGHILGSLNRMHSAQDSTDHSALQQPELLYSNYVSKLKSRYAEHDYSIYHEQKDIYDDLISYFTDYEEARAADPVIIHGDPVFTNILVNSFGKLKFIDMRGMQGTLATKVGDRWYDYGKVYQSLLGYDEILLDRHVDANARRHCIEKFESYITNHFGVDKLRHVQMIAKGLLFSLLPLHSNNCKRAKYFELAKSISSSKKYASKRNGYQKVPVHIQAN